MIMRTILPKTEFVSRFIKEIMAEVSLEWVCRLAHSLLGDGLVTCKIGNAA